MTPERAQELLSKNGELIGSPLERQLREAHRRVMKHHGHPPDGVLEADIVRAFLSIQAAEIARLQAKVEAAEARERMAYNAGYVDGSCGCKHRVTGQIGVSIGDEA